MVEQFQHSSGYDGPARREVEESGLDQVDLETLIDMRNVLNEWRKWKAEQKQAQSGVKRRR